MSGNKAVLRKLFLYSIALAVFPVAVYFLFDMYIAATILGHNSKYQIMLCGGMAAFTVNVILGLYVYMALTEDAGFGRGELKEATSKKD